MRCKSYYIHKKLGKVFCDLPNGHDGNHHAPTELTKKRLEKNSRYQVGKAIDILASIIEWKTGP